MRTFLLIIGGFVVVVAAFVLILLGQDRSVKTYAETVLSAAQTARPRGPTDCTTLTSTRLPNAVQSCTARVEAGRTVISLRLRNGRGAELASGGGQTSYSMTTGTSAP